MRRACSLPGVRTGRDDGCITGRGTVFCGLVIDWISDRTLSVAAVSTLLKDEVMFGWHAIGLVMSFLASLAGGLTTLRHPGAAALADASCCADHPARCSPCGGGGRRSGRFLTPPGRERRGSRELGSSTRATLPNVEVHLVADMDGLEVDDWTSSGKRWQTTAWRAAVPKKRGAYV